MDSLRVVQQLIGDRVNTTSSHTFASFFACNVHALDVSSVWRVGDYVELEDEAPSVRQHPHTFLIDATQVTLSKSDWIFLQRIHAAGFQRHRGLSADDELEIFRNCKAKSRNISLLFELFVAT